jgi:hypothetical protein
MRFRESEAETCTIPGRMRIFLGFSDILQNAIYILEVFASLLLPLHGLCVAFFDVAVRKTMRMDRI